MYLSKPGNTGIKTLSDILQENLFLQRIDDIQTLNVYEEDLNMIWCSRMIDE